MLQRSNFQALLQALLLTLPWAYAAGPNCHEVTIPASVLATNKLIPSSLNLTRLGTVPGAIGEFIGDVQDTTVAGTWDIIGRYCEPERKVEKRKHTVQLLVHGLTYTKEYWSGDSFPGYQGDKYSWIAKASREGYPTLSIDRIGSGQSDLPDPTTVVQLPLQVQALRKVVKFLRDGTVTGRKFHKVIYVGHDFGSLIGNVLTAQEPDAVNGIVLTGFSTAYQQGMLGFIQTSKPLPAAIFGPPRFDNLLLFEGYTYMTDEAGRKQLFFHRGGYDPDLYKYDLARAGTLTVGELITSFQGVVVSAEYEGPVFVMNGAKDTTVCSLALKGISKGHCNGYTQKVSKLYPSARQFGFFIAENTGHVLNLHHTAQKSFAHAHDWMNNVGF